VNFLCFFPVAFEGILGYEGPPDWSRRHFQRLPRAQWSLPIVHALDAPECFDLAGFGSFFDLAVRTPERPSESRAQWLATIVLWAVSGSASWAGPEASRILESFLTQLFGGPSGQHTL